MSGIIRHQFLSRNLRRSISSACGSTVYDMVIHGGGVVGAAVAANMLFHTQGRCKICLIEAGGTKLVSGAQPDARVYALSPKSIKYLDRLGAWQHIRDRSHPYSSMQIWESSGPGLVKFRASEINKTELGRICEDVTIQAALYKVIAEMGHNIDIAHHSSILETKLPPSDNPSKLVELVVKRTIGEVESEHKIFTRLLVGADGANSLVRRLVGIPSWGWSYGQEAVVATVSLRNAADASSASAFASAFANPTAWQRYLPTGPLALLPCWGGYSSIVWSVPVPEARRLKALSQEAFLAELNAALRSPSPLQPSGSSRSRSLQGQGQSQSQSEGQGQDEHRYDGSGRSRRASSPLLPPWVEALLDGAGGGLRRGSRQVLQELSAASEAVLAMAQLRDPYASPPLVQQVCSARLSFPLSFQQAKRYAAPRCALVGDAAHSIHPQAGQGLNLGLADAASLCAHLLRAQEAGQELGQRAPLEAFSSERRAQNLAMMCLVDLLHAVFQDSSGAAEDSLDRAKRVLRAAGMLGVHNSALLKAQLAAFAMGAD
jgi:ubiquinone biosynthesis monooxygenase Coq6